MHRSGSGFLLTLAIIFAAAFTGCLGNSSTNPGNGGVKTVSLSPGAQISLETGGTQGFSASATDALGHAILGINIQFIVESGSPNAPAPLSVASNGSACAGTWDPTTTICSPGNPGIALVTAVANGVSSAVTTVYVHQHVDSVQISRLIPPGPPQQMYDCFPQGQTWEFGATAYSHNVDITSTVGPVNWSTGPNFAVATVTPYINPLQTNVLNLAQTTAKIPGITQLSATAGGTTSAPYPYTTCLIQSISLQIGGQGQAGNSITVSNGGSVSVTATVFDTLHLIANTLPLTNPPLTWSTTNPEVATFSTTTNSTGSNNATTRANLGGAILTASCTPPTCNIGLPGATPSGAVVPSLPIYASDGLLPDGTTGYGAISVDVTAASTSKAPTYTAWAATTDCANAPGCTSALFSVTPSPTAPIGTIINLPRTPNSMMFNHVSSARVYFGSDQGLMYLDVTAASPSVVQVSNSATPCNVSLCGKVLTISNDGQRVVVSDTVSTPSQVYIYNASSGATPVDLVLSNPGDTATAAAFSPDGLKLFILTNTGKMYVYSTVDALAPVQLAPSATDIAFSADGSFAYVAGSPAGSVSAFSTCSLPDVGSKEIGGIATSGTPLKIFPSPVLPPLQSGFLGETQTILALEQPNTSQGSTSIEFLTAQFTQDPIVLDNQFTCNPPAISPTTGFTKGQSFDLGQGTFTPIYSQLVNDGAEMIVVGHGIPAVLLFDVSSGTTQSIPLLGSPATGCPQCAGNSFPLAASASTDGSQVHVAACDQYKQVNPPPAPPTCTAGSVHIINTCAAQSCNAPPNLGSGDFQQVPYVNINDVNNPNMCNNQGTNAPLCLPNLIAIRPQ